ncbi:hypothetical protein B0H21DRAFT_306708 [Amylocystis lapponica]|nr:hypothetical protein B0H21DRAFT_306708 [Amylocystis lapponica]
MSTIFTANMESSTSFNLRRFSVDSADSDAEYHMTFDEFISMPEDDLETIQPGSPASPPPTFEASPYRSNVMSLDFILSPYAAAISDLATQDADSYFAAQPHAGMGHNFHLSQPQDPALAVEAPDDSADTNTCVPSAVGPSVVGWAPADGSAFVVIKDPGMLQARPQMHTCTTRSRTPDIRLPSIRSSRSDRENRPSLPVQKSPALLGQPINDSEIIATMMHAVLHHAPSPLAERTMQQVSPQALMLPHLRTLDLPIPGSSLQPHLSHLSSDPFAGDTPLYPQRRPPPPPPRGGVSPALARSITHIRIARARAQHIASQAGRANVQVPSVMARNLASASIMPLTGF